jgi:large subunit ribosomal protein L29
MTVNELRALSEDDLVSKLADLKNEYLDAKLSIFSGALKDTSKLRKLRNTIARAKTTINERKGS